jgi:hypothetical protein
MSRFENINNLLEGSLTDLQEKSLFAELASDSSYRTELRTLLSINQSLNENKNLFTNDDSNKTAVLSKLGLGSSNPWYSFLNTKASYSVISSIATILLMTIFFINNGNEKEQKILSANSNSDIHKETIELQLLPEINYVENIINNVKNDDAISNYHIKSKNFIQQPTYNLSKQTADYTISENKNNLVQVNKSLYQYKSNKLGSKDRILNISRIDLDSQKNEFPTNELNNDFKDWSIEWNGSESIHFPKERITPSEFALFHNNSLSLLYKFNDKISFGASVRQETFYLTFSGFGNDGIARYYEQQPNLTTFSGLFRYNIFNLNNSKYFDVRTFTEIQVGANSLGPVGRFGLGLEISPIENITFIVSGNYNHLRYWHQNQGFKSEKFSLNYGVKFGL